MAITDSAKSAVKTLVKEIQAATETYRAFYIGRCASERRETLRGLFCYLYADNIAELQVNFPKALILDTGVEEISRQERLMCLIFLLKYIRHYQRGGYTEMAEFVKKISTGGYGMQDLPYPE